MVTLLTNWDDLPSTVPETNSSNFAPANGWLEDELRFLLGRLGLFFEVRTISFMECNSHHQDVQAFVALGILH